MPKKKAALPSINPAQNSKHLVSRVADDLDCTIGEANKIVSAIAFVCASALKRDETVQLDGVGFLKPGRREGYMHRFMSDARKPSESDYEWLPPRRGIRFRPRDSLLKLVNEEYQGLESLEELYVTYESRPARPHR